MRECINEKLGKIWYEITIDNSTNAEDLTDYQILLEIVNDSTFFEDCQNEQKYLEFYDTNKATLLNHYVEEFDTTNKNAKIWIKVPSIPANSIKTIYLKINTERTTDLSNPDAVFDFYDDWIDGVIDETKWEIVAGSPDASNGYLHLPKGSGKNYPSFDHGIEANFNMTKAVFECRLRVGTGGSSPSYLGSFALIRDSSNKYAWLLSNGDNDGLMKYDGSLATVINIGDAFAVDPEWCDVKVTHDGEGNWEIFINGVSKGSATDTFMPANPDTILLSNGRTEYMDFYYVRIRKYTKPEPTVSYAKA